MLHRENLQLLRGKFVNVIGKPHNLFRETLVNVIGKHCRWGNTITFIGKGLQELLKFPTTVFPYNVYKFSLKRLWSSPITFTILPITIKDFPCNFIVVSLCIVFPYHFYKYGMYFPRKSLHSFTVYIVHCIYLQTIYIHHLLHKVSYNKCLSMNQILTQLQVNSTYFCL